VAIEVACPKCEKRLRAPEERAGRQVRCPQCKSIFALPKAGRSTKAGGEKKVPNPAEKVVVPAPQPKAPTPPAPAATATTWTVQTPDGNQYGPVTRDELDDWFREGRLDGQCQLLKAGADQWQWADTVFPQLAESSAIGAVDTSFSGVGPFSGVGQVAQGASAVDPAPGASDLNPFASPSPGAPSTSSAEQAAIPEAALRAMAAARPWMSTVAIVGFVVYGFGLLGGLILSVIALMAEFTLSVIAFLVYVVPSATMLYCCLLLFRYSGRLGQVARTGRGAELTAAMRDQATFWKTLAIIILVVIALMLISTVLMIVAGLAAVNAATESMK